MNEFSSWLKKQEPEPRFEMKPDLERIGEGKRNTSQFRRAQISDRGRTKAKRTIISRVYT